MSADPGAAAPDVLFLPFTTGQLTWPTAEAADLADPVRPTALFLRARVGRAHTAALIAAQHSTLCVQSFKPEVDALQRAGWTLVARESALTASDLFPLVLVLPPRQRDEARALMAQAFAHCAAGGVVVACMANDEGAKSGEADLKRLAGLAGSTSKQHCRVFWAINDATVIDEALLAEWSTLDAPRPIADARFISRPGVFAWDRIDIASQLLAAHLPNDLRGRAADLGAGFGYLSVELLQRCPGITALDLYEAEARALDLAKTNLERVNVDLANLSLANANPANAAALRALDFHWQDVTAGVSQRYDVIVTNPPFHAQQSAARPDIGRAFIEVAAEALLPGGRLWLVANRNLPYELALDASFGSARIVAQQQGFKIIEAIKAAPTKTPQRPVRKTRGSGRAAEARAWRGD